MQTKKRIAIIGGGITGLVAAYDLALNFEVTVYERAAEVGGLAAGFSLEGTSLEKAYHHIFTTDTDIIALTKALGIADRLVWKDSSIGVYYEGKLYPFVTPMDLLRFSPLRFLERVRLGIVVFYLQKQSHWKHFITVTADHWLQKWCGSRIYTVIWKPLLQGKFHQYASSVSMAWLWARIHTRANSRKSGTQREQLGYFKGGFQTLVSALREQLIERGVVIKLQTGVDSLEKVGDGYILKADLEPTAYYDAVICTAPSHVFARLLESVHSVSQEYLKNLRSIQYLDALCVIFTSTESLSPYYWNNINDTDSPFLVLVEHTNLIDRQYYNGLHVYYLGTYLPKNHRFHTLDKHLIEQEFFTYLKRIFPHFNESMIKERYLFSFKNAQHIVDTTYLKKLPDYMTPLQRVYLANFSQIFPEDRGTNFAVREGYKIAQLVCNELLV